VLSAVVVLLQFAPSFTLAPGRAARVSGILLFVLAGVVALSSFGALMREVHPDSSWSGIAVTIAALAVMPVLARAKRVAGEKNGKSGLDGGCCSVRYLRLPRGCYSQRPSNQRSFSRSLGRPDRSARGDPNYLH
jgi:ABC-type uncharacterized transport system permease subunit